MRQVCFKLDALTHSALLKAAEAEGASVSEVVRRALSAYLSQRQGQQPPPQLPQQPQAQVERPGPRSARSLAVLAMLLRGPMRSSEMASILNVDSADVSSYLNYWRKVGAVEYDPRTGLWSITEYGAALFGASAQARREDPPPAARRGFSALPRWALPALAAVVVATGSGARPTTTSEAYALYAAAARALGLRPACRDRFRQAIHALEAAGAVEARPASRGRHGAALEVRLAADPRELEGLAAEDPAAGPLLEAMRQLAATSATSAPAGGGGGGG